MMKQRPLNEGALVCVGSKKSCSLLRIFFFSYNHLFLDNTSFTTVSKNTSLYDPMQWGCYSSLQEILKYMYLGSTNDNKAYSYRCMYTKLNFSLGFFVMVLKSFRLSYSIYNNNVINAILSIQPNTSEHYPS